MNSERTHRATEQFTMVPDWVADVCLGNEKALALYRYLAHRIGNNPRGWDISRKTIMEATGWSLRTVIRKTMFLIEVGAIKSTPTLTKDGDRGWNNYKVVRGVVSPVTRGGVSRDTRVVSPVTPIDRYKYSDTSEDPPYPPVGGTTTRPRGMRVCDSCRKHGTIGVDMRRYERRRLGMGDAKYGYLHSTCEPIDKTTTEGWL